MIFTKEAKFEKALILELLKKGWENNEYYKAGQSKPCLVHINQQKSPNQALHLTR